jgi:hypothetical protein
VNNVVPQAELADLLALLLPQYPITSKVHLYQNNLAPGPQNVVGDFTEATYDGYVALALTAWGTPFIGPDGNGQVTAPGILFVDTGFATPNTIYGYYLTNAAGTVLLLSGKFDAPILMNNTGIGFVFVPTLELGGLRT